MDLNRPRTSKVIRTVCEAFGVAREELGQRKGQQTPQRVRFARGACGLLARQAARVSISAMGRLIGYEGKYLLTLTRKHRTLLRWATWPKPPAKSGAVEFRNKLQAICQALGVDLEDLSRDP